MQRLRQRWVKVNKGSMVVMSQNENHNDLPKSQTSQKSMAENANRPKNRNMTMISLSFKNYLKSARNVAEMTAIFNLPENLLEIQTQIQRCFGRFIQVWLDLISGQFWSQFSLSCASKSRIFFQENFTRMLTGRKSRH